MSFINTTGLRGETLEKAKEGAAHQNILVLEVFRSTGAAMGPSVVYRQLIESGKINMNTPITSIRRSISNLTQKGLLVKTKSKIIGGYGKVEFCWAIKPDVK